MIHVPLPIYKRYMKYIHVPLPIYKRYMKPKLNLKPQLQRDLKNQNQNRNKSVDRTGSACTNTKTPHVVAKKNEEQGIKRQNMRRI